jgi:Holliday junction resolvase RusA-like endonuclease
VEPGIVGGRAVTFHVKLPLPPSANKLFFNVPGKGRVKTRAYKNWRRNAVLSIFAQVRADQRIGGPVGLSICVPNRMRGDLDNRLKGLIDALVASNRIDDDKHVGSIRIVRGGIAAGMAEIKVQRLWSKARQAA